MKAAGFVYFVEGVARGTLTPDQLSERGLSHALAERVQPRGASSGPGGCGGLCLCDGRVDHSCLGYFPDRQEWRPMVGAPGGVWCGLDRERRPRPDELARDTLLDSNLVADGLGVQWAVPAARRFHHQPPSPPVPLENLPRRLALDVQSGRFLPGEVQERYRPLWQAVRGYTEAAEAAVAAAEATDSGEVRFDYDVDGMAILALQANYRLSATEIDLLGIWDEDFRERVIEATLDQARWRKWQAAVAAGDQKKTPPSPATTETSRS